jgi:ABC-type branched-subunit amino acid transport system ATPase component
VFEFVDITKSFGGTQVLRGLSLTVEPGLVTALVGPNGAGKTTLFNVATGFLKPDSGTVLYHGREVQGMSPYRIGRLGIGRSFQEVRLFPEMTVRDNVAVAMRPRTLSLRRTDRQAVAAALAAVGLAGRERVTAADLSYAEQKGLALSRLIAQSADVLLLDEPTSGLDERSLHLMADMLRGLRDKGMTILLIEHNLDLVRRIADRVAFLAEGTVIDVGPTAEILGREDLALVYFGEVLG